MGGLQVDDNLIGITGGTDGTAIGNVSDRLLVQASLLSTSGIPYVNRQDIASAARTTNGNTSTFETDGFGEIGFITNVTAVSGTNPKLDFFLSVSEDNVTWSRFIQTRRFTATGNQRFQGLRVSPRYYRYEWEISGTTPSFTFDTTTTLKAYMPRRFANKIQYGFDLTQATNSVSETFTSADNMNVSLITIRADDGGSGAQYKVQVSNDDLNYVTITNAIAQGSDSQNASTFNGAYRFYRLILTASANVGTRVMDIHWASNS